MPCSTSSWTYLCQPAGAKDHAAHSRRAWCRGSLCPTVSVALGLSGPDPPRCLKGLGLGRSQCWTLLPWEVAFSLTLPRGVGQGQGSLVDQTGQLLEEREAGQGGTGLAASGSICEFRHGGMLSQVPKRPAESVWSDHPDPPSACP